MLKISDTLSVAWQEPKQCPQNYFQKPDEQVVLQQMVRFSQSADLKIMESIWVFVMSQKPLEMFLNYPFTF